MLRSPCTLRDSCIKAVKSVYRSNWSAVEVLPRTLQDELLWSWLRCDESQPLSDDELAAYMDILEESDEVWNRNFSPEEFVRLMRLPVGICPPFAHNVSHVIYEYIKWVKPESKCYLCYSCYLSIAQPFLQYSKNLWELNGWEFYKMKTHEVVKGDDVLEEVIWNEENWCSRCITFSLIKAIVNYEDCLYEYDFHLKKRRYYDSSADEETDYTVPDVQEHLVGKRLSNRLFKSCKRFL